MVLTGLRFDNNIYQVYFDLISIQDKGAMFGQTLFVGYINAWWFGRLYATACSGGEIDG